MDARTFLYPEEHQSKDSILVLLIQLLSSRVILCWLQAQSFVFCVFQLVIDLRFVPNCRLDNDIDDHICRQYRKRYIPYRLFLLV